jgi:hypothetical protein
LPDSESGEFEPERDDVDAVDAFSCCCCCSVGSGIAICGTVVTVVEFVVVVVVVVVLVVVVVVVVVVVAVLVFGTVPLFDNVPLFDSFDGDGDEIVAVVEVVVVAVGAVDSVRSVCFRRSGNCICDIELRRVMANICT